jgi:CheY-like chemotaxis protein
LVEQVRDALLHLYDPVHLQEHPLLAHIGNEQAGTVVRSKRLRQALLDAVAALYPGAGVDTTSPAWRGYRILELRYLEDRPAADVMLHLGLSKTQYHREHNRALHAVASVLWESWQRAARLPTTPSAPPFAEALPGAPGRREGERPSGRSPGRLDAAATIREVSRLLQPLCHQRGVRLEVEVPAHVPYLLGDRVALRHALLAILSHAVHGADRGSIGIRVERTDDQLGIYMSGSAGAPLSPADLGLPPSEPFVTALRGHAALRLGASAHHDWVVELSFPVEASRTLLVVDNSEDFIRLVQHYLHGANWEVRGALDVESAHQLAENAGPSAILLDIVMPGRDGWDLLLALKGSEKTGRIPVIICSVIDEPDVASSLGADAVLQKPIDQQRLIDILEALGQVSG